ncbi:MAG TPA: sulfite exporter TauE/SafE family protein [Acidimicrobiales bacterium]|nr:sulfite exporter TauE/SafE family protein [Acidimicrobiales bacterium]
MKWMLATNLPLGWRLTIIFVAGVAAGISNGIAGGGTFLSFPTLIALGVPTLQANVSSSVGILPSLLGGMRVFRREITSHKKLLRELAVPCVLGSVVGCVILLEGSNQTFTNVVPWLIGAATLLFAVAPRVTKLLAKRELDNVNPVRRRSLFVGIFIASVYGGYFGAGLGIVLLAVMALTLPFDIYELQGIRSVLGTLINAVAAVVFIVRGHLALDAVYALLIGSLIGGWLGTMLVRRVSPSVVRTLVILVGAGTTIRLAIGS